MPQEDRWLEDVYHHLSVHLFQVKKDIRLPACDTGWRSLPAPLIEMPVGGSWTLYLKGKPLPITLKDHEVVVIPTGMTHRLFYSGSKPMKTYFIFGAFRWMLHLDLFNIFRVPIVLPRTVGTKLSPIISAMDHILMNPRVTIEDSCKVHELAFRALNVILANGYKIEREFPVTELDRVNKALNSIHENQGPELSCKSLALKTNLSPSRFREVFKKATGVAPKIYQRHLKLKEAITMLTSTQVPVNIIADKCKFNSSYYFTRFFTKHIGLSPSQFRKNFSNTKSSLT